MSGSASESRAGPPTEADGRHEAVTVGGIEAGGTKWVCGVGGADGRLLATATIPTTDPQQTIARAVAFFREHGMPEAIGIGAFGPVDLRPTSPTFGSITTTPKPGWAYTDLVSPFREALGVPVTVDTDVNAAALAEWLWGAGVGLETFSYVTVGTGIGGGAVVNGRLLHGHLHPELGHMRIPHDRARDPFPGTCSFHGDCFEGLASGEAMRRRWGVRAEQLADTAAWELEAEYLAHGLLNVVCALAPERIIVGGGVAGRPGLLALVRERLRDLMAGYLDMPSLSDPAQLERYVVAPLLGGRSGLLGALALASGVTSPRPGSRRR